MIAASVLFIALAFRGVFDWIAGLVLLGALGLALADMFIDARKHKNAAALVAEGLDGRDDLDDLEGADPDMPWWKIILFLVLGLVGLPLGADILVDSATVIARTFGISETVIGLTLVAVGTSMPELATTVMAAIRRQADVALGNVIGSNLFNLLAIIGVASFVAPIPVDSQFLTFDLWVMLAASLLLIPFVFLRQNIGRIWGVILILFYTAYVAMMFV